MVKFFVRRRRASGVRNLASLINVNIREVTLTWVPLPEEVAALAPHLPKEDSYAVFVVDNDAEGERLAAEIAALFGKDDFVAVFAPTEKEIAAGVPAEAAGEEVVAEEAIAVDEVVAVADAEVVASATVETSEEEATQDEIPPEPEGVEHAGASEG